MNGLIVRPKGYGITSCKEIAARTGGKFKSIRADRVTPEKLSDVSLVFRWGYRGALPGTVEEIQSPEAMKLSSNKAESRAIFAAAGIAPQTQRNLISLRAILTISDTPWVIRPKHHKQGKDLFVVRTEDEAVTAVLRCGQGWYASVLVEKKQEFRVLVADGRILYIYEKLPEDPQAVAWNHSEGSTSKILKFTEWPQEVCLAALEAVSLLKLDFGAVDVMVDENQAYVLEVNCAPETAGEYRQEVLAKFLVHRLENGKSPPSIPYEQHRANASFWRHVIHPAQSDRAILEV